MIRRCKGRVGIQPREYDLRVTLRCRYKGAVHHSPLSLNMGINIAGAIIIVDTDEINVRLSIAV